MAKRIFEVAKEFGVKAPQIIELLGKYYISKTNFDKINDDELLIIKEELKKNRQYSTTNDVNDTSQQIDWNEYDETVITNTPIEEVAVNFVKKQA